jgi:hypothetical protein
MWVSARMNMSLIGQARATPTAPGRPGRCPRPRQGAGVGEKHVSLCWTMCKPSKQAIAYCGICFWEAVLIIGKV